MRMDLPQCNFKNCRKYFDGNCRSIDDYRGCEFAIQKSQLKAYKEEKKWEPIVDAYGELKEFICDCGRGSSGASNYCPDCGTKMDNSDIEIRIKEAISRELN